MLRTLAVHGRRWMTGQNIVQNIPSVEPGLSLQKAPQHGRTHGIGVAVVHVRSHEAALLDIFTHFACHAASALHIPITGPVFLPTQRSLWTVVRSPFAHKKSQENFQRKVHKRAIKAWDAHPHVVDAWLKYLRLHILGGVAIKVTTWEHLPLHSPLLAQIDLANQQSLEHQIKSLGADILRQELPD